MKRGTENHPKVWIACKAIGIRRPALLGHLELLWAFTSQYAPQGDIGKYPDDRIEAAMDWLGRRGKLIAGLVLAGWVDAIPEEQGSGRAAAGQEHGSTNVVTRWSRGSHEVVMMGSLASSRLVVHDWHEHCAEAVKKLLARRNLQFIALSDGYKQTVETLSRQCLPTSATQNENGSLPIPMPYPCQTPYPLPLPLPMPEPEPFDAIPEVLPPVTVNGFEEFWLRYPQKVKQDQAARMWVSVVTVENVSEVFTCLEAYEKSDLWARGTYENADNWLVSRARNNWKCRPVPPHQPKPKPTTTAYEKRDAEIDRLFRERMERHAPKV